MTLLEEDVEIEATSSPTVGVIGSISDVFEVATIGELVAEEGKLFESLSTE
jgi:hypothetical protein